MRVTAVTLGAAALLAAGCGGTIGAGPTAKPAAADDVVREAPPLTAVDREPPEPYLDEIKAMTEFDPATDGEDVAGGEAPEMDEELPEADDGPGGDVYSSGTLDGYCIVNTKPGDDEEKVDTSECGEGREPTPEQLQQAHERIQAMIDALKPAPDSPPRVVAALPRPKESDLILIAWKNAAGELCTLAGDEEGEYGAGWPGGGCFPYSRCNAICLDTAQGDGRGPYALGGTIAADAETLRVTVAGGTTYRYPLTGPLVRDSSRRAFMADLGEKDWRHLELLNDDGEVTAERDMPKWRAATEDCFERFMPLDAAPGVNPMDDFEACLDAAAESGDASSQLVLTVDQTETSSSSDER